jgi:hypothetical protein
VQQRRGLRVAPVGAGEEQGALGDPVLILGRLGRAREQQHDAAEGNAHTQAGDEHEQEAGKQLDDFTAAVAEAERGGCHGCSPFQDVFR